MDLDDDSILDQLYDDWEGTLSHTTDIKDFFKTIKTDFPEIIFHGTDVGHQYNTTGRRYLQYLEDNNQKDSQEYLLTQEAIEQGEKYYKNGDDIYRENVMVENFIREFDSLDNKKIMGIYGSAHTGLDSKDNTNSITYMANQLNKHYPNFIYSENISWVAREIHPIRTDVINVGGKDYQAVYFGQQELNGFKDYAYREYWILQDSYDDFKDSKKTMDWLPESNYIMAVEEEQVFVIDYIKLDGSTSRSYYIFDGKIKDGEKITNEIIIK